MYPLVISAISPHAIAKIHIKAGGVVPWLLCYGCCNNGGIFAGQNIGPGDKASAKQAAHCV